MANQLLAAGLLMCKWENGDLLYFLVHPGGPFYANKDAGVWSIPKGLPEGSEDLLVTAQREFKEETGIEPVAPFFSLGSIKQKRGKVVHAWAFMGNWDPATGIICNNFTLEWPPRSGKIREFPEQDRAAWMSFDQASAAIIAEQIPLLERAKELFQK
jgi:predicted NUDIX family NTP pyrophosphohydrolase